MSQKLRSYTSTGGSLWAQLGEFRDLIRGARSVNHDALAREVIEISRAAEAAFTRQTGRKLESCKLLEIGPGQSFAQMLYFSRNNDVVGIDLDVVPFGADLRVYWKLFRVNGLKRLLKTVGRKIFIRNRPLREALRRQLGIRSLGKPKFMQMDAAQMTFADNTFDFVYSFRVFEHLPNPRAVVRAIRRVLKPGGVAYINLHLYTSDSGCHDLRIIAGNHEGISFWPHLRPGHEHEIRTFAYLNKLRMSEWRELFAEEMPGSEVGGSLQEELRPHLERLRAAGELRAYSDQELLTRDLIAVWQKPR